MAEFERDMHGDPTDAIRIEVEVPRLEPAGPAAIPDGSSGGEDGPPPASPEATVQQAETPPNRTRHWLLRAVGLGGVLALTLGILGLSSAGKRATAEPELPPAKPAAVPLDAAIRPFSIRVPESDLVELRRRVNATRWPDRETVSDDSQGVKLSKIEELVRYWGRGYDWRKVEAKLNSLPQFVTTIDGAEIHFLHVRSKHEKALPVIITHGWPGSVIELVKAIGPLTNPTAHGGKPEEAFDVVIPSMPGYGFSSRPEGTGWGPERIARAWATLMDRLAYDRYVSQGGDWGSVVAGVMAKQMPRGLLGIHVNMPATVPPEIAKVLREGGPAPAGLSVKEKAAFESLNTFYAKNTGYSAMMVTRPQTVGYALTDSPVGLAAWHYDKFSQWTHGGGDPERSLTKDEMLDDITLYWLTNSAVSSARLYWENNANNFNAVDVSLPAAITVFPGEIYRAPRSWAERAYRKLIYFNEVEKGGHFAAWEEPELFARELRAAFKSLR